MKPGKVFIAECSTYNIKKLQGAIERGFDHFRIQPEDSIFIKPDCEFAHYDTIRFGFQQYTNPQLIEAVLNLLQRQERITGITIGVNSIPGIPSRLVFKWSKYRTMIKCLIRDGYSKSLQILYPDEHREVEIFAGGSIHRYLRLPERYHRSSFKLHMPKLKGSLKERRINGCITSLTGLLNARQRTLGFNYNYGEKMADLGTFLKPDFIIMDAICVGEGTLLTPQPVELGCLMMSTDPVAVDVCAMYIFGQKEPMSIDYMKGISRRGKFIPAVGDLEIKGDFEGMKGLDELQRRFFENLSLMQESESGKPSHPSILKVHEGKTTENGVEPCIKGCKHMAIEAASLLLRTKKGSYADIKRCVVVFGKLEKGIDTEGNNLLVLGNCTSVKSIDVVKIYRVGGCPAKLKRVLSYLSLSTNLKNPFREFRFVVSFIWCIALSIIVRIFRLRLFQDIACRLKRVVSSE